MDLNWNHCLVFTQVIFEKGLIDAYPTVISEFSSNVFETNLVAIQDFPTLSA